MLCLSMGSMQAAARSPLQDSLFYSNPSPLAWCKSPRPQPPPTTPRLRQSLTASVQEDVHAAVRDLLVGLQSSPLGGGGGGAFGSSSGGAFSSSGAAPGGGGGSGSWGGPAAPAAADVDAFLEELERQLVSEVLGELEQLEAYEAAELAAAVAEREALMGAAGEAAAAAGVVHMRV